MKKLLLASAMALFSLSNAQIKPGTVYISGQVGYTQKKIIIQKMILKYLK
ncbi:hypothetical protein [Chryseobacterium sp. ERMR1:04]|nr:hypothetical protein [Chryseobacterium sp. ERMR1:04]